MHNRFYVIFPFFLFYSITLYSYEDMAFQCAELTLSLLYQLAPIGQWREAFLLVVLFGGPNISKQIALL